MNGFFEWIENPLKWSDISHLKRLIINKELLDESRLEIKFRRKLEELGLKDKFIHDQPLTWKIKYRPDFFFPEYNLVIEYDEIAHNNKILQDKKREKVIKKYIDNLEIIRVKEGEENKGLSEIKSIFQKYSVEMNFEDDNSHK